MSKFGNNSNKSGNSAEWQEKADKAWEETLKKIDNQKTGGIYGFVGSVDEKKIKEPDEAFKDVDNSVAYENAVRLIEKLAREKALIVSTKQGGLANGCQVKPPVLSIYKDTLTVEFGTAKANKDADPVGLKATFNKEGEITGVYASTGVKEMQGANGKFSVPVDYRKFENVENLPGTLKTLADAIGFHNPVKEQDANKVNLPEKADKFYSAVLTKLGELNKTAPTATVKDNDGKDITVKQYNAYVEEGHMTAKGSYDSRPGIEGDKAYRININDHAQDGANRISIVFDKDGEAKSATHTDFGNKGDDGKYASTYRTNISWLASQVKGVGDIVKAGLDAMGYEPPKDNREAPEQEVPEQTVEEDLPFEK